MLSIHNAFSSFSVNNIDEAKKFYGDTLGFKITDEGMGTIGIHPVHDMVVFVYPKEDHQPATFTILNFKVKNIENAVAVLSEKGIKFEQYEGTIQTDEKGIMWEAEKNNGPNIAWFRDPAGNILSLIEEK